MSETAINKNVFAVIINHHSYHWSREVSGGTLMMMIRLAYHYRLKIFLNFDGFIFVCADFSPAELLITYKFCDRQRRLV